ncbi:MAG: hypothetical protein ACXADB_04130 [Candidatus Hermodarchaeia archaeon]
MWRRGNRGRGRGSGQGPWPGHGPFSHLPPWQRPGWLYGPGSCWNYYQQSQDPSSDTPSVAPPQFITDIRYCHGCKAPLLPNANFCANCGVKVEISDTKEPKKGK